MTAPAPTTPHAAPAVAGTAAGGAVAGGAAALWLLPTVQAQAASRQAITDTLWRQVSAILRGFTGWYDDVAVKRMSAQVGQLVAASQRLAAATTNAYLTRATGTLSGAPVRPSGTPDLSQLRAGVDPAVVYERLARQYRYEQSQAYTHPVHVHTTVDLSTPTAPARAVKTPDEALKDVLTRAEVMVDLDVALAVQKQSQEFMDNHERITGYRRVLHPELSRSGSCGLCIAASDRVYRKSELMPIHARCHCETLPVIAGKDPAGVLNDLDLKRLYKDAGGTGRSGLKRQRYTVNHHGELGPVLTAKGDSFRTPADVAAVA